MKQQPFSEHPIIKLLTCFSNLIILNIIFIITSIPIFTIGASITAAYRSLYEIINEPTPSVIASYVRSFRMNFKSSTIIWVLTLFGFLFFIVDSYVILFILGEAYKLFLVPVCCMIFILLSIAIYAFPLLSLYNATGKQAVKNAIFLSLSNIPTTIFIIAIGTAVVFFAFSSLLNLAVTLLFGLIFGFATLMYIFSFFLFRIFKKCE